MLRVGNDYLQQHFNNQHSALARISHKERQNYYLVPIAEFLVFDIKLKSQASESSNLCYICVFGITVCYRFNVIPTIEVIVCGVDCTRPGMEDFHRLCKPFKGIRIDICSFTTLNWPL